jgi:glycogen(starch) synthase
MKNLRVLMIGPGVPDAANSGLGIVVEELRKVLTAKVSLISIEPGEIAPRKKQENKKGFTDEEVIRDLVRVSVTETLDTYSYFEPVTYFDTDVVSSTVKKKYDEYTEAVVNASLEYEFDVIYAHDWVGMEAAMILQEESGKPLVLHIHSLDIDRLGANHKSWVYDIEHSAIEMADAIIAVSQYSKDKIVNHYGGDPAKITVIYPALPDYGQADLKLQPMDQTVLFLGRFASQKRPFKFVEIAEKVLKKNNEVHFLMVGDGDLKDEVIEYVAQKGLGGKIHFSDYIPHKELAMVFEKTSLLCITSDSEPFGLTALEAAEAGIPVVMTEQSGAREVLSGALVVNKDDVAGFAKAITKMISNQVARTKAINTNRKDLSKLDWDSAAIKITDVFHNLVK